MSQGSVPAKRLETREGIVIRFAGDSGDGMQVTGLQFTAESALAGNDLATLPDFPAEIRAPAGTLAGVSASSSISPPSASSRRATTSTCLSR